MVRLLISLRGATLAHQRSTRFGTVSLAATGALGIALAVGTLLLGIASYPTVLAGSDVLALSLAVWMIGRVAFAAFGGGDGGLPLEIFRLLPIPRAVLSRALLVVGLADPALVVMAISFASLAVLGGRGNAGALWVGVGGGILTLLISNVLVTCVGALLPPRSRRRQDFGTTIIAVVISLVAVTGSLTPTLSASLNRGTLPWLSAVVRILPSGWAADAVAGARLGDPALIVAPLVGLFVLLGLLVLAWPTLLSRRLDGSADRPRGARSSRPTWSLLPGTPIGGVAYKEVRMWFRDPLRVTFLLIGALIGIGTCVVPVVAHGTTALLPFAGILTVLIAGAGAANLYGSDGLSLRLTVVTPASSRPDVRGRQLAWLVIVAPYALVVSVILTVVSGQEWAWPWMLGILAALLGGAAGVFTLASVIAVQTLAPGGGLTAAWPVKVYATLVCIALSAAPTVAVLIVGTATGLAWLDWLAVGVGVASGIACTVGLGRLAIARLETRQYAILEQLTAASSPA